MLLTAIVIILIFSLLVLIHELGHFLVAKRLGIGVEEFGFGLPLTPRIFGKKIGETIYSFYPLLLGGFVKLYGEEEINEGKIKDKERAFFTKPISQRVLTLTAGVIMNTILGITAFYFFLTLSYFRTSVPLLFDHKFFAVNQTNKTEVVISKVSISSPAESAGIKPLSKVIAVDGKTVENNQDFTGIINSNKGKKISLRLKDLNTTNDYTVEATPRISPPEGEGPLGVAISPSVTANLNYETPAQKIFSGISHPLNLLVYSFEILGEVIAFSFEERTVKPVGEAVTGPIGIIFLIENLLQIPDVRERILQVLNLLGLISISLALFNILPIPALDGGRLLFVGIEAIIGRRVKPKIEALFHQTGFILLMILIVLVSYNDLLRFNVFERVRNLFP